MANYLVIEDEQKAIVQIEDAMRSLDSSATLQVFKDFKDFQHHLIKMTEQNQTIPAFDFAFINLSSVLLLKWTEALSEIKTKIKPEAPLCLISFDNEIPSLVDLKKEGVYNVIHKPFDELILSESLVIASQLKKRYNPKDIKSQKNSAIAGILKDVELQSISELGFLTLSDSEIPLYSISKYFSELFDTDKKQSVWAQCLASIPHPHKPGFFINKFQFYYTSREFLIHIRKKVQSLKAHETSSVLWHLNSIPKDLKQIKISIIAMHNFDTESFKHEVESHFQNAIVEFLDVAQAMKWKKKSESDIVFNLSTLPFEKIKTFFNDNGPLYFWVTKENLPDEELKQHVQSYREIFKQPYDRAYFYKKLKSLLPDLILKETPSLLNVSCHEIIKAANLIEVLEMNELYISFNYPRELEFDTARNFILLNEKEEMSVEIPGFCHFKEKSKNQQQSKEQSSFFHQFAFFSVSNEALKEIRQWLLHSYIAKNQKN